LLRARRRPLRQSGTLSAPGNRRRLPEAALTIRLAPPPDLLPDVRSAHRPPIVRTSFVGRSAELIEIGIAIAEPDVRLVTIVGRSGVGKSRLAIEFAHRHYSSWPGGAVFVELGSATGRQGSVANLGAALGSQVIEGQAPEEAVRRRLRLAPALIVLDDLDLAADVIDDLLDLSELSPATRFLASANTPIGHVAERIVRLRPLPIAPDDLVKTEALAEVPAIALYVERAAALDPNFALDDGNALAVAELTRQFDGLPLAIELGAARARIMSPKAQLAALEEHSVLDLRAPRSDPRTDRHRNVRTAVAASYAVASDEEQTVLRHLSVFAGGCTSQRLREVVGETNWTLAAVLDALVELVDLGLVEVDADSDGEPRYRLLPTIAAFARERLEIEGEADAAEHRRELILRAAARKTRKLVGPKQVDALTRDTGELEALFAGLAVEGRTADALEVASDLGPLWSVRGLFQGPGTTFAELLGEVERSNERIPAAIEARAMVWWTILAVHAPSPARDREAIRRRLARGLELARAIDDPELLLFALNAVVAAVFVTGDMTGAAAATTEGLALAGARDDRSMRSRFEYRAAILALSVGDVARGVALAGTALLTALEDGDLRSAFYTTTVLRALPAGTPGMPSGVPTFEGLLTSAERAGDRGLAALILSRIAAVNLQRGDIEAGAKWALRGLARSEDVGAWYASGFCIAALAQIAAVRGDAADAARLHGSLTPIATEVFTGLGPGGAERYQAAIAPAREQLGSSEFDRLAADAGLLDRDASVEAAATYARSLGPDVSELQVTESSRATGGQGFDPVRVAAQPDAAGSQLTPREVEILRELMTGATNQRIAEVLGIRAKTVMHHSVSIYAKLGVRGRTEATAWAYRNGLSSAAG
jgi:predicted ATPase/DNA-binding CsgD family transcriptional regulator